MTPSDGWKKYYSRRFKSRDGHLFIAPDGGKLLGTQESLIGYLAEVCPPGALEHVGAAISGATIELREDPPRELFIDPRFVADAVQRGNGWLEDVHAGRTAGVDSNFVSPEDNHQFTLAGVMLSAGLLWMMPPGAVEGMMAATQRAGWLRSSKLADLSFCLTNAATRADMLRPLVIGR